MGVLLFSNTKSTMLFPSEMRQVIRFDSVSIQFGNGKPGRVSKLFVLIGPKLFSRNRYIELGRKTFVIACGTMKERKLPRPSHAFAATLLMAIDATFVSKMEPNSFVIVAVPKFEIVMDVARG